MFVHDVNVQPSLSAAANWTGGNRLVLVFNSPWDPVPGSYTLNLAVSSKRRHWSHVSADKWCASIVQAGQAMSPPILLGTQRRQSGAVHGTISLLAGPNGVPVIAVCVEPLPDTSLSLTEEMSLTRTHSTSTGVDTASIRASLEQFQPLRARCDIKITTKFAEEKYQAGTVMPLEQHAVEWKLAPTWKSAEDLVSKQLLPLLLNGGGLDNKEERLTNSLWLGVSDETGVACGVPWLDSLNELEGCFEDQLGKCFPAPREVSVEIVAFEVVTDDKTLHKKSGGKVAVFKEKKEGTSFVKLPWYRPCWKGGAAVPNNCEPDSLGLMLVDEDYNPKLMYLIQISVSLPRQNHLFIKTVLPGWVLPRLDPGPFILRRTERNNEKQDQVCVVF